MKQRKKPLHLRISAILIAAVLLILAGCSAHSPAVEPAKPSVSPIVVIPIAPTPTPSSTESPAVPSPEPEVSDPVTSPEPEASAPVDPPEPEASEPAESPEPETTEPVQPPDPEVSQPSEVPTTQEPQPDEYGIYAPRVGLYDAQTLTAIHEKAAGDRMASASMSKIVTALTALRYVSPDTVFTVGTELQLVQPGASICLIAKGHRLTLEQLLMGLLLPSGCDAAYTIAVNVARLVAENPDMSDQEAADYFCGLMNDLAAELGAADSHFVNPDGWDHEDHYTTVRDMALFAARAMEHETLRNIVSTPEQWVMFVSGENITWQNSNSLLHSDSSYYHPDAVGMKTGTTEAAGNCLLSAFERNGTLYIAVVAGSATRNGRYEDTLKLLELLPN